LYARGPAIDNGPRIEPFFDDMSSEIVINSISYETRVALLENGQAAELYIERKRDSSLVGNIYKGRVARILPGMQSAFIDIGLDKAAFLYVSDATSGHDDYSGIIDDSSDDMRPSGEHRPIEEILQEGQDVMVQVSKDPIGTKGARVTTYCTLPGRYLVLMPDVDHVGVSRRLTDDAERDRLRAMALKLKTPGYGYIVRTVSEGCSEEELAGDMEFLKLLWENIIKKNERVSAPQMLYSDLDLAFRSIRDLLSHEVERLVVDSADEYNRLLDFVRSYFPKLETRIEMYEDDEPVFDAFGIELDISRALGRKVWLKSGGYIVIDQTEALTTVDVNTGKYVGKETLEDTILKTNLEAVKEIAYQIRLRNLGGIIIIDFIDMEKEENRQKLFSAFREAMSRDRAKNMILNVSELGLVQMTRKRVRESLERVLCEPCPYCEAKGVVKSTISVCYEILRKLRRMGPSMTGARLVVMAHPSVIDLLYDEEHGGLEALEHRYRLHVTLKSDPSNHQEHFEIRQMH